MERRSGRSALRALRDEDRDVFAFKLAPEADSELFARWTVSKEVRSVLYVDVPNETVQLCEQGGVVRSGGADRQREHGEAPRVRDVRKL
ncbi:hypothetical protein GCM10014719_58500 [Planomonospora parontospora subsp. antibiotica]|nr:hypothetical protein GCM10014719_58500 [Planomonospora parontospora subsp. antibiotica]GII15173.1 hypothetical protein Ppa05_18990 [Planomonospora parontospora subsp. antibiotica]